MDLLAAGTLAVTGAAALAVGDPDGPAPLPELPAGGAATPPPLPDPAPPAPDEVIWRTSEIMPAPVLGANGLPSADWEPSSVIDEPWAALQVVIEGVDITAWRGVPIPHPQWSRGEPFGPGTCTILVPQITTFEALPAWCVKGASVDVVAHLVAGGTRSLWSGVIDKFGHEEDPADDDGQVRSVFTVSCRGPVLVDDLQLRKPGFDTQPRDIGQVIPDVLNAAVSRRCDPLAAVVTGCLTGVQGGWEPLVLGHVQGLLATAVTGGRQWTLACDVRSPVLVLKDTTTVHATVSNGQRGVTVSLEQDHAGAPNVIYGEGISPAGGRWRNAVYPGWRPDDAPPWPMSPTQSFRVGTTDAATTSGTGVSDYQRQIGQPVTGRFSTADTTRTRQIQAAAGIAIDGRPGPQTWATVFAAGANTGTLDAFFLPLAWAPQVMPRLYGPDGTDLGPNPAYDPSIVRVETKLDLGQGVTKDQGRAAAAEMLPRVMDPGWIGTIRLEVDPNERSRYELREGQNVQLTNFRGGTLLLHVAYVEVDEDAVTLTVDTNARDYPTLDAIMTRERAATDPAKSIAARLNKGSVTEARATFDDESPAGQLPRHALFADLWDVRPVPFGAYGSVARTELTTTGAAARFCTAVFTQPVTHAQLEGVFSGTSPLVFDLANPWETFADELAALGLVMAWGWGRQPLGYWPLSYATPDGTSAAPVTGRYVDDAAWEYVSSRSPWLWVATIADRGCLLEGHFWPGVD